MSAKKSGAADHRFNQNRDCKYFPCHAGADLETFNCKHCYCPLYFAFPFDCGGNFTLTEQGIKDCTGCLLPHLPDGHEYILGKLRAWFEGVRSRPPGSHDDQ